MPLTEARAVVRLASYFNWTQHHIFPNVHFLAGEMDLAVVTRARRLWEIEVKLSLADWRADEKKRKWKDPSRRFVSRFFYAVPSEMIERVPSFVPETTGLLELHPNWITPVRPAKLMAGLKITDAQIRTLLESTYNRFWRERIHRHRQSSGKLARGQQSKPAVEQ